MSDAKNIIIWLPLRPGASWRGEGIAQTVENIIKTLDPEIEITVVTTAECEKEFDEKIKSRVKVKLLKWINTTNTRKYELKDTDSFAPTLFELMAAKFSIAKFNKVKKLSKLIKSIMYVVELRFICLKINLGWLFSRDAVYWFPAPNIYGIDKIKRKKIISFWDPFVFEYRDFGDMMNVLYLKFYEIYRKAEGIITQSESNKRYLIDVMGIDGNLIKVINNGSPDYSRHYNEDENKRQPLQNWLKPHYVGIGKSDAISSFVKDKVNKSILWRLLSKKELDNSKTIIISTQDRPYKGLKLLLKLLDAYVDKYGENINIVTTAHFQDEYRKMYPRLMDRIYEITRVSEFQHSILYGVADLAIHPSFVEGGLGAYPQFEAASMKKPSLVNTGRHITEMISVNKLSSDESSLIAVDFTNIEIACEKIKKLLHDDAIRENNIKVINKCRNSWGDVGMQYSNYFKGH
jgi:glycosyltransferase involved in cell wall biosynthesis